MDKSEESAVGTRLGDLLQQKGIKNIETAPYKSKIRYLENEIRALKEKNEKVSEAYEERIKLMEQEIQELRNEKQEVSEGLSHQRALVGTLFDRAVQELKKENHIDAMGLLQAFMIYEPENVKCLINLAVTYGELGYYDRAKKILQKVIVLDPDNEIAKRNLEVLKLET